ncbi:hypothetical protein [Streptomyces sp. NPDC093568]|uniref:hypothetical protein n=1 Tax=Streptomyces sp. NPDC093568 TaxID=3366041 RepID=UPI003812927F
MAEITHLGILGELYRAAPGYAGMQDALDTALKSAQRHLASGVGWEEITRALGIPLQDLQHRIRETAAKPRPVRQPSHSSVVLSTPGAFLLSSQNWSPTISTSASQHAVFSPMAADRPSEPFATPGPSATARGVLFLAGDPRPGRNEFGTEAANIRQSLAGSLVDLTERMSVGLPEICSALDRATPAVLHIAAHSSFGGVHLSQDGKDLCIGHDTFCEEITRARVAPRLVILNFCGSATLAHRLAPVIEAVIGWPDSPTDRGLHVFTRQLYRSLVERRSVTDSVKDAEAATAGPYPELGPPALHGNPRTGPF